jgi:hypothetical protein
MTMTDTTETVAPEQTLNAPEPAQTAPEVANPEVEAKQETPEPPKEDDAEKAKRAMQRRIDKRTADLYRERAQNEQLAQRLAALEARASGEPEQQAKQVDPVALAREIATVERVTEKANDIARDGEKRFASDWRPALEAIAEEAGPLFEKSGKPTAIGEAILDAEDPAALLHHLGKNPDLAAELQGLSPAQLGRRIGRIEAQMSATPPPKPVSKAPEPARPIGATSGGTMDPAKMTMAEYKAYRKGQGASWAR